MKFNLRKIGYLLAAGIMGLLALVAARRTTEIADYDPADAIGYESGGAYVPPSPVPRA